MINTLRYIDPTGHGAYCGDDYDPSCLNDEELEMYYEMIEEVSFDETLGGNVEDEGTEDDESDDGDDLTSGQIAVKAATTVLVEFVLVLPTEISLFFYTIIIAIELGPPGVVLDLVLLPAEIAVADFGLSLALNTMESQNSSKRVDFKWTLLPAIISELPEPLQEFLHDIIPGIVP
jgi:hypothetical protein